MYIIPNFGFDPHFTIKPKNVNIILTDTHRSSYDSRILLDPLLSYLKAWIAT